MPVYEFNFDKRKLGIFLRTITAIAIITLLFAVVKLRTEVDSLHGFVKNAADKREQEHKDQLEVDCEIAHKLDIYVQLCGGEVGNPPFPMPNPLLPSTTTTTVP